MPSSRRRTPAVKEESSSDSSTEEIEENDCIGGRFYVGKLLGSGSFGTVREAFDQVRGAIVAIKLECGGTKHAQLHYEFELYQYIPDASGAIVVENMPNVEGFPAVYWYGGHSGHRVLVMDVLGPSLEDVHRLCCRRFSLHTVLLLGLQMLERIEAVHSCGILHRDIKPQNFCLGHGKEKNDTVYLIDMGLSKPFLSPDSNRHIPCISGKKLAGTARYASIATHLGYEQGRRDDVESLAYVLLYLLHGSLPWRGIHASSKRYKYKLIGEKKQATPLPELCGGVPELELYIQYCRNLAFEEQPDYEYLKGVLHSALARTGRCVDAEFDWKKLAEFKSRDGLEGACRSMKPSGMTSDKEAMASPVR